MTSQRDSAVGLELKYCEQCGGLWLRSRGSADCYCAACARFLENIPPRRPDNRRRGGSGPLRRRMRRQQREPGTELVPLAYLVAGMQAERAAREAARATGVRLAGEEAPYACL